MISTNNISRLQANLQQNLFPMLESHVGELSPEYKKLTAVLELIRIEEFMPSTRWNLGRPCKHKYNIARAFIAKSLLKISYTKQLIARLKNDKQLKVICGWESFSKIPSEATFSRLFNELANSLILKKAHALLVSKFYENQIIGHIVNDSTPIIAREKPKKKEGSYKDRKRAAGKRYLEEKQGKVLSLRRKQLDAKIGDKILEDLPRECDIGRKKNSEGFHFCWKGYKLHVAITDNCIPVSCELTSASLNDCEVAIPLMKKSNELVHNFYYLMDSAYDVPEVKEYSTLLKRVAIIDENPRCKKRKAVKESEILRKQMLSFSTAEDIRYKKRLSFERFNALFKDFFGGRNIFYRGYKKIEAHCIMGILGLTASTMLNL